MSEVFEVDDSNSPILLTGGSGLIGSSLNRYLTGKGRPVIRLVRPSATSFSKPSSKASAGAIGEVQSWDPYAATPMPAGLSVPGLAGAVHLSGAAIAGRRWTAAYKREIVESRVRPTEVLARLLARMRPHPEVLLCASAIGIYGGGGEEALQESAAPGRCFLAEVCAKWEQAAQPAVDAGIRVVHLRFGVVLSPEAGALAKMLPIFRLGLGGRLGGGRQWLSWISLTDAVRAIEFALESRSLTGPVNVVAPSPVTNAEFARMLGRALGRPALLPVPAFALKVAFGEMAQATILEGARVVPAKLEEAGFEFRHPSLPEALRALLQ